MTPPMNRRSTARSQRRFLVLLAAGLGLVAFAAVYLVVQLGRDDGPNAEIDFAEATCEDFELAELAEGSAISVESANTDTWDDPDVEGGHLYCNYTSDSGLTLTVTVIALADEGEAQETLELAREVSEVGSGHTIEEFDDGDHAGLTRVFSKESVQRFNLFSAAGRLSITIKLEAKPAAFEPSNAVDLVEALAAQARERFQAYV